MRQRQPGKSHRTAVVWRVRARKLRDVAGTLPGRCRDEVQFASKLLTLILFKGLVKVIGWLSERERLRDSSGKSVKVIGWRSERGGLLASP